MTPPPVRCSSSRPDPRTVWSRREPDADEPIDPDDEWDPLHTRSAPGPHWTTDNLGEAAPGVLTPLGWSIWRQPTARALHETFYKLGVFTEAERDYPEDPEQRVLRAFHGRAALQVEFMATVGNRMPGTTGQEVVRGLFVRVPEQIDYTKTRRRYPAVVKNVAALMVVGPRRIRAVAQETDRWWRASTRGVDTLDRTGATALLRDASTTTSRRSPGTASPSCSSCSPTSRRWASSSSGPASVTSECCRGRAAPRWPWSPTSGGRRAARSTSRR